MSITTILATDLVSDSRTTINGNFSSLADAVLGASSLTTVSGIPTVSSAGVVGATSSFTFDGQFFTVKNASAPALTLQNTGTNQGAILYFKNAANDSWAFGPGIASPTSTALSFVEYSAGVLQSIPWTIIKGGVMGVGRNNINPSGTCEIYDAIASTGITRFWVREGAGQTTSEAFGVYANDGTTKRFDVTNNIATFTSPLVASGTFKIGANQITLGGAFTTSGAFATTLTTTATTSVTLPTSGTLVNSAVTTLSSLASVGTITTGVWTAGNLTTTAAIGNTPTVSVLLNNVTPATVGAQKISPAISFAGLGWGTTAGASQTISFRQYVVPVQGLTATGLLTFDSSLNGAAFAGSVTIDTAGNLTATGYTSVGNITAASSAAFRFGPTGGRSKMTSPLDSQILLTNNAGTDMSFLQFGGTTSSFPAIKKTSSTSLSVRLADDSADAALTVGSLAISATSTPAASSATGTTGQIVWDSGFVYVCTASNTWKRSALATW